MSGPERCHVCGEPIEGSDVATCNTCDRRFHVRLRQDSPGVDCGEVFINEEYLAVQFACFACLGTGSPEPPVGSAH